MNRDPKLVDYAAQILRAKPESSDAAFSRAAHSFETDLAGVAIFPTNYLAFVLILRKRLAVAS